MTVPASRDIESIIDFIAGNSGFDAAEHFLNKINVKCKILANFPNLGRRRDELNPSLRIFSVDDYLIFYCPVEEGIEIGFRVVPSYRKVSSRLQRLYPYVFLADKHTFSMYFLEETGSSLCKVSHYVVMSGQMGSYIYKFLLE